jgi:hypothetical protein
MARHQLMRAAVSPPAGPAAALSNDTLSAPPPTAATSVPRWAPLVDMALLFDGVDDRVVAPTPEALKIASSWTFGFWMRPAATEGASSATGTMAGLDGAESVGAAWSLGAGQQLTASFAGAQNVLSLADYFREWTDPVPAGVEGPLSWWKWVYVATVYDDTAMSLTTLVNAGDLMDTVFLASPAPPPAAGKVTFGYGGAPEGPFYAGMLSRVTLWRRALTAYEVGEQMRTALVGGQVMGMHDLAGAWRMDEGYGGIAFDYAALPGSGGLLGDGNPDHAPEWTVADPTLMPI